MYSYEDMKSIMNHGNILGYQYPNAKQGNKSMYDPNTKYTCLDEKDLLIKMRCLQVRLLCHLKYRLLLLVVGGLQAL